VVVVLSLQRMQRQLLAVSSALAIAVVVAAAARADIDGDQFESMGWRVRMTAPKNWQLTEQTSYPNVLLWMVRHGPDGKMLLSAERVKKGEDGQAYANRTAKLLDRIGFSSRAPQLHAATGAYWIDLDNGHVYLRQAFLVADGIGYALTLSARDGRTRSQHLRAFDSALRSIRPIRREEVEQRRREEVEQQKEEEREQKPAPPPSDAPPTTTPPAQGGSSP